MANTKLSAFFSLLLVFLSGAVFGAVGFRAYTASLKPAENAATPPRKSPEEYRKMLVDEMTREVHLNDAQLSRLSQIYGETCEKFMDLRQKSNSDGRAIRD